MKFVCSTLFLAAFVAVAPSTYVLASINNCNLECENDGVCTLQWQTEARSTSSFVHVMACQCKEGFTGPLCETDMNDNQVDGDSNEEECSLDCLNGGECLWHWVSQGLDTFAKQMTCDCPEDYNGSLCENEISTPSSENNATSTGQDMQCNKECINGECVIEWTSDPSSNHKFISNEVCKCESGYEGDLCQDEANHQSSNTDASPCSHTCHNGGTCVSRWETAPLASEAMVQVTGCECAPGFTGPSCEVEVDEDSSENCHLECQNGGQCVFAWMEAGQHNTNYFNFAYLSSFMICECPAGYMGMHCEYSVEKCPDNTMCFNGGKCFVGKGDTSGDPENVSYTCDCSDVPDREGSMCEQQKQMEVNVCDYDHVGHERTLFCVNGGTCDSVVSIDDSESYHHGCDCPDDFFGYHCEFMLQATILAHDTTATLAAETASSSRLNATKVTLIVLFSVAGVVLIGLLTFRALVRDTDGMHMSGSTATAAVPSTTAIHPDGTSLAQKKQDEDQPNRSISQDLEVV